MFAGMVLVDEEMRSTFIVLCGQVCHLGAVPSPPPSRGSKSCCFLSLCRAVQVVKYLFMYYGWPLDFWGQPAQAVRDYCERVSVGVLYSTIVLTMLLLVIVV